MITVGDVIALSVEIQQSNKHIKNEDMTIDYCIKPLLKLLNYSKPSELMTKYPCYKTRGKSEEVDIALVKNDKPLILIECKDLRESVTKKEYIIQLKRYFESQPSAKIGILTNGLDYHFYTDLENINLMDSEPFFSFNINTPSEGFELLCKMYNDENLDLEDIRKDAEKKTTIQIIKNYLLNELQFPSEEFTRFVIKQTAQSRKAKKNMIADFKKLIIDAYKDINSPVIDRPKPLPKPEIKTNATGSYAFTTPSRLFVIDKWFDVKNWGEVKSTTYSYILGKDLKIELLGRKGISNTTVGFRRSAKLMGNWYTDIGFSADNLVRHCKELLSSLGFDSAKAFIIETDDKTFSTLRERSEHGEAEHLNKGNAEVIKIYNQIKRRLIDDFSLSIEYKKKYIAFKAKSNVVDIEIQKNQLKIYLNISKGKLIDPKKIFRDISNVGHWGNGDYSALVNSDKDIDYIVSLVKQIAPK